MGEKKLTIRDIAQLAGVSKTTVSRYINGRYDLLSEEARQKVEEVVDEYHYVPNSLARSLATNSTKTIGVSIADITNPFSSVMINGINDECKSRGYSLLFVSSNNDSKEEKQLVEELLQRHVDGLIINTTGNNDEFLAELDNPNVVMIDRLLETKLYPSITSDNYNSTYQMISLLCNEYGYERIYFISQSMENVSTRSIRYASFADAIKKYLHLDANDYQITLEDEDEENFRQTIVSLSKSPYRTAFFTVNGVALKFLLQILKEEHITFPKDVGVCTYEYWDWTELIGDGITSIAQDSYEMGRKSAEILIEGIESGEISDDIIKIPSEIFIRGSC